jgi:predicted amidohydrolase
MSQKNTKPLRLAIAQLPITASARKNSKAVQGAMRKAAQGGARLIQFPEGMLSGYAKHQISSWEEVDWQVIHKELAIITALAAELKIWVVLGSAHPLTPPHWPHNSLYIISDDGSIVNRYDKRIVSHTEVTTYYTAGYEPVVFEVDGFRFGCIICVEIHFPKLFMEYNQLGVDCLLLSAYPVDAMFYTEARAHAAMQNYWVSMATPAETASFISSALIGPNGEPISQLQAKQGLVFGELDPTRPEFDIALTKARPWRASVETDPAYNTRPMNDPRSVDRTCG